MYSSCIKSFVSQISALAMSFQMKYFRNNVAVQGMTQISEALLHHMQTYSHYIKGPFVLKKHMQKSWNTHWFRKRIVIF